MHRNAPLTPEGRRRQVLRVVEGKRPVAHVAAEAGISRQTLSKWVARYRSKGEAGLWDRRSVPRCSPNQAPDETVRRIEQLRREDKLSPRLIASELAVEGRPVGLATVHRWLVRLGISRLRDLDVSGATNRQVRRIHAREPGHMVHLDVKKIGRIPDGGGWRVHGRGSGADRQARRQKVGYCYFHTALDGYSRLAYTEVLPDEQGPTAAGFFQRAQAFFAAHGIRTLQRVITDNGSCYRSRAFAGVLPAETEHRRIRPHRPQTNGKVERYQRILTAEFAYARPWTSDAERSDWLHRWNIHYNYHRAHTAIGDQPPASATSMRVTNLQMQNI